RLDVTGVTSTSGDFASDAAAFSLEAGETRALRVTFHPASVGPIAGTLRIRSNDSDEPERTVALSGTGIPAPVISVSPASLQSGLAVGGQETRPLVVRNTGGNPLSFELEFQPAGGSAASPAAAHEYTSLPKGAPDPRVGDPVIQRLGGPDQFGYGWIDSDTPGGPQFQWVDITGIGTRIPLFGDDIVSHAIPIGFTFPFHGSTFTSLRICSNGFLSFTSRSTDWVNQPLPNAGAPENLLAVYWDDIYTIDGVYTYNDGTRLVIEYPNVFQLDSDFDHRLTFEV